MKQLLTTLFLFSFISCINSQKKEFASPPGYDFNHPEKFTLPAELSEISGNSFSEKGGDTVFAIQDEKGAVYFFKPGDKTIGNTKFAKKGDYEEISIFKNTAVILRSDGTIFTVPMSEIGKPETAVAKEWPGLVPNGEYESLFADTANNALVVLCKECKGDKKDAVVSGYVLNIENDSITTKSNFKFDVNQLGTIVKKKKYIVFKPSAIAKSPVTADWYILSSVNKLLVITDAAWKVKSMYELDPDLFEQPEGMAFDAAGNLFISSEMGETNAAILMKFVYKK